MKNLILTLIITIPIFAAINANADGGLFFREAEVGYSADQKAILVYDPEIGEETMILHTEQGVDESKKEIEYAWIIPVPTLMQQENFTTFEDAEMAFTDLYYATEPRGEIKYGPPICGGGICASADNAEDGLEGADEVRVVDNFQVDNYEIQILTAEDSENLQIWLQENGYRYTNEHIPILEYYIDKNWYFTAVKIARTSNNSTNTISQTENLNPLQLTFKTDKLIFPLKISKVSSNLNEKVEVLLYVFAPYRVQSSNFTTLQMEQMNRTFSSLEEFRNYYNEKFTNLINSANGKALIVENVSLYTYPPNYFADVLDLDKEYYLTRLRTEISPLLMNEDIEFMQGETNELFVIGKNSSQKENIIRLASALSLFGIIGVFRYTKSAGKFLLIILVLIFLFL